MSKAKHTPGPWKAEIHDSLNKNIVIYTVEKPYGILNIYPGENAQANAQLIADAPLLLEALTDVMDYIEKEMIMSAKDVLYFQAANRIVNKYKREANE